MSKELINIVLDLETISSEPDACIIQIGACVPQFDWAHTAAFPEQVNRREFEATIRYEDCLQRVADKNCTMSAGTMEWWETQPSKVEVFSGQEGYIDALYRFKDWIMSFGVPVALWGYPASFDCTIIRYALDGIGLHKVLPFRNDRDLGTLKAIFPPVDFRGDPLDMIRLSTEIAHTGLGDARYEARVLNEIVDQYSMRSRF